MLKHDLGYYVDVLLRRDKELSLFPEFYKLFYQHSLVNTLASLRFHPDYKKAIEGVALKYGADAEELDEALESVLDVIMEAERGNNFALVLDFIGIFGGTQLDVPSRKEFDKLVFAAEIYVRVIKAGDPNSEVLAISAEGTMEPEALRTLVDYVHRVVDEDDAIIWKKQKEKDK